MQNNQHSRGNFVQFFSNMVFKPFDAYQAIVTATKVSLVVSVIKQTGADFPDMYGYVKNHFEGHEFCALGVIYSNHGVLGSIPKKKCIGICDPPCFPIYDG